MHASAQPLPASPARGRTLAAAALALAALAAAPARAADTTVFAEDFSGAVGSPIGYPYGDGFGLGAVVIGTQFRVSQGNVDVVGLPSGAPWACGWSLAGNCLDLVGAGQSGGIESIPAFNLQGGTTYAITFGASSGTGPSSFAVTMGGYRSVQTAGDVQGSFRLLYTPTADEHGVHLGFATTAWADAYHGAVIDNVRVATVSAVPEAGTWALMLAGLGAVGAAARRRQA